mmetsp:Transcript_68379/g.160307  ORF Transcript_68379/g.160307 Transcript_68379/m.160307 type:complete len:281 (-) Transcript_68379:534-1376(-)
MKSIGRILMSPFGGKDGAKSPTRKSNQQGGPKLSRSNTAPSLPDAEVKRPSGQKATVPKDTPKWLAHELQQEKMAQKAMQDWQEQLKTRLLQLREKSQLNDAMNSLVLHLKNEGLTEGELFAKIDSDGDGELSRQELQVALRRLGVDLTTTELDGILRIFDADGSGSIDFAEFYHLLKSQEALLPQDFVPHDVGKKKDPLHNFEAGDRVRLHLCMSNRALHFDEHDESKNLHGKIVGPGTRKGTLLMQLEESDCTLLVKPRQVSKTRSHTLTRAKTSVLD